MDLIEKYIDGKPELPLSERFQPLHEATLVQSKGKYRWTCICGDQQEFPPTENMDEVMRSYARHTGLVERRK